MQSDKALLQSIQEAFCDCSKPEHFTNYAHCDECQEHDDTLRAQDADTLAREHVGNSGWDPLCFTSPEGIAYLFPALCRIALQQETGGSDWYGPQLLFHLTNNGQQNRLLARFSRPQKDAVIAFLRHMDRTRRDQIANYASDADLYTAIKLWS